MSECELCGAPLRTRRKYCSNCRPFGYKEPNYNKARQNAIRRNMNNSMNELAYDISIAIAFILKILLQLTVLLIKVIINLSKIIFVFFKNKYEEYKLSKQPKTHFMEDYDKKIEEIKNKK